jgi:Putative peptidoglycan binding domain
MQCNRVALAARTAGAVLAALVLTLVLETAPASGAAERAGQMLIPSAGWDGRPIQEPHRHDVVRTSAARRPTQGWSAGPVSFGTGFHRPGGSARVREVQRRLSRLGYHVGPVDGLFGRLTRASVAWFQVKHGLDVDGRATLETVRHLRARTGAGGRRATEGAEPGAVSQDGPGVSRAESWETFNQLVGPRLPVGERTATPETNSWRLTVLLVLVAVSLLLLIALFLQQISARRWDPTRQRRSLRDAAPRTDVAGEAARRQRHISAVPETGSRAAGEPRAPAGEEERPVRRFARSDDGPPGRAGTGGRRGTGAGP